MDIALLHTRCWRADRAKMALFCGIFVEKTTTYRLVINGWMGQLKKYKIKEKKQLIIVICNT